MKRTKLFSAVALVTILIVTVLSITLSGCGESDGDKIPITMIVSKESINTVKKFREFAKEYEKQNPNVKVQIIEAELQKILTMFAGGTGADIITMHYTFMEQFIDKGIVANLAPLVERDEYPLDDFFDISIETFSRGDKLYGIPYKGSTRCLFYNKDIFDKYGVIYPDESMDWDDFIKKGEKLTVRTDNPADRTFGYLMYNKLADLTSFIWADGADWVNDAHTKSLFTSPKTFASIEKVSKLWTEHKVVPNVGESEAGDTTFETGKIAMIDSGPWNVPEYRELSFSWDVGMHPEGNAGRVMRYAGMAFALSEQSKVRDEAWKFVKYLSNPETGGKELAKLGLEIPPRKSLANSEIFNSPETPWDEGVFIKSLDYARPLQSIPNFNEINEKFGFHFDSVIHGDKDLKTAMELATKEIDALLAENQK